MKANYEEIIVILFKLDIVNYNTAHSIMSRIFARRWDDEDLTSE